MMRLPAYVPKVHTQNAFKGLKDGLKYLKASPSIGRVILLIALYSLMIIPYFTLLPVIAKMILNGNATTYGYLNNVTGIGAIGGAIFLASLKPNVNLNRVLFIIMSVLGIGLILLSFSHNLLLALFFAAITGFAIMSLSTIGNTLLQLNSSTEMRGRVISYFAMAYFGLQPLCSLLIGSISNNVSTPTTIFCQGIAAVLIAILFFPYLWKEVRLEKKVHYTTLL